MTNQTQTYWIKGKVYAIETNHEYNLHGQGTLKRFYRVNSDIFNNKTYTPLKNVFSCLINGGYHYAN